MLGNLFDVKAFGAIADGIHDDANAIQSAINAASSTNSIGKVVLFSEGTYRIDSSITLNNQMVSLLGINATITTLSNQKVIVGAGKSISGIIWDKVFLYFPYNHKNAGKMNIENCFFKNVSDYAIYSEIGYGTNPANLIISDNIFDSCGYSAYGGFTDSIIRNNQHRNSTNRNIEIVCGSSNQIIGNRIDKGITGISLLVNRSITEGNDTRNNIIQDNIVSNISEEAIGLDLQGNISGSSGSVISGTVKTILTGGSIQFIPSFSLTTKAYAFIKMYVVYLSGKAKGQAHPIIDMGNGGKSFIQTATGVKSDIAVGDKFVIMIGVIGNIISNNIITDSETGISLYGDAFETIVTGNRVVNCKGSGISVRSLYGVIDGYYGMAFNNIIDSNILSNCNIDINTIAFGSAVIDVNVTGNHVTKNTVINGNINYSYQDEILIEDNIINGSGSVNIVNCSTTLPVPSQKYVGQQRYVRGKAGSGDGIYVCIQLANLTYQWKTLI